ncbi:MAG TPA: hypothetical protein VL463_32365 [Kofleriaceae bacterium]|jgi:hypothetical protein|nr:hypothetical protein [Kofleriaceae bacterium]
MRTTIATLLVLLAATPAFADKGDKPSDKGDVAGTYDVKYDEVSNNCTSTGMTFTRGTLKIEQKKNVVVNIDLVPIMQGSEPKAGKIKATSKLGASVIQGLDGRFSVAGRVDEGVLQLVFVAEYYVKGKPLCTQSWNVAGVRQNGGATKSESDAAESAIQMFRF